MRKLNKLLFSISFTLMIITGAIYFTVIFKPLYYYDIKNLNISEYTGMSYEEIKLNYDYMIDYNVNNNVEQFKLPTIISSEEGAIHFEEVRDVFQIIKNTFYVSVLISIVGTYYYIKNSELNIFSKISKTLIATPIIISIPLILDFEKSFVVFHKILFRNDYWIFDPKLDPVINILPEEFFFHGGIFILTIILVCSLLLNKISKINDK